jgi:hypothetical protein
MLDSSAARSWPEISCVFCPQKVTLEICQPRHGHMGEDISNIPPYINIPLRGMRGAKDWTKFIDGKLFRVLNEAEKCELTSVEICQHGNPYAYGNPQAPDFGFGNGLVIWVCKSCWTLTGSEEKIISALRVKDAMWHRLYEERGLIVCESAGA